MAKKNSEPKFRSLTVHLSCGDYASVEVIAERAKVSKSFVISALLSQIDTPFARGEFIQSSLSAKMMNVKFALQKHAGEMRIDPDEEMPDSLMIQPPGPDEDNTEGDD